MSPLSISGVDVRVASASFMSPFINFAHSIRCSSVKHTMALSSSMLKDFLKLLRDSSDAPLVEFKKPFAADRGTYDFREVVLTTLRGRDFAGSMLRVRRRDVRMSSSESSLRTDSDDSPRQRGGTGGISESESSGLEDTQNEERERRDLMLLMLGCLRRVLVEACLLRLLSAGRVDVAGCADLSTVTGNEGSAGSGATGPLSF